LAGFNLLAFGWKSKFMKIDKGTNVAVLVNRHWANLQGVRTFLRHYQDSGKEIRGSDESHIIFADVLDSEDSKGLWIELYTDQYRKDSTAKRLPLFIAWGQVLCIVIAEEFSPAIREEARQIGFVP
jgi:hypothetical protein